MTILFSPFEYAVSFQKNYFHFKSFGSLEVINDVEKMSRRCFSSVIVAIKLEDNSTELSEFENENLIAQLQLLNSVYEENFLEKITILIINNGKNDY